jgi:hypothetical protein
MEALINLLNFWPNIRKLVQEKAKG